MFERLYFHKSYSSQYSNEKVQSTTGKKKCTVAVALMKARDFLDFRCREKHINWKKKKLVKLIFFFFLKLLAKRFWLTLKRFSRFNNNVHG